MPLEKDDFRDNLTSLRNFLDNKYGDGRHLMKIKDVCEYTGRSYEFVKKAYKVEKTGISINALAHKLS